MSVRFASRLACLNEQADEFLKRVACLGGHCTIEQARQLGLANSLTRTTVRLNHLERVGFLRRVLDYPVIFQVTKSVARLLARDLRARRRHSVHALRNRLLGVNFYLEAIQWPAEFIFEHDAKLAALADRKCLAPALPQRGGLPYLWEEFVLRLRDGRLCVAAVDRMHHSPFLQARSLIQRFSNVLLQLEGRLRLNIAVHSEARCRLYLNHLHQLALQGTLPHPIEKLVSPYRVRLLLPAVPMPQPETP